MTGLVRTSDYPSFVANNPAYRAVWDEGIKQGYQLHQIAGVIGNLHQESQGNPLAKGDGGHAIGIAQWNDRAPLLKAYAEQKGADWQDYNTQAAYLWHELNTTEKAAGDRLRAAKNTEEATTAYLSAERPAGWGKQGWQEHPTLGWQNRLGAARKAFGADPSAEGSSTAGGGYQGPFGAGGSKPVWRNYGFGAGKPAGADPSAGGSEAADDSVAMSTLRAFASPSSSSSRSYAASTKVHPAAQGPKTTSNFVGPSGLPFQRPALTNPSDVGSGPAWSGLKRVFGKPNEGVKFLASLRNAFGA